MATILMLSTTGDFEFKDGQLVEEQVTCPLWELTTLEYETVREKSIS